MDLQRTVRWIEKTESRDKFCKSIQYSCRFLKDWQLRSGNKQVSQRINALFTAMKDARKLFRLFKSLNEFQKIMKLTSQGEELLINLLLKVAIRVFYMAYWFFDNLSILSKMQVFFGDTKKFAKIGSTFWLLALMTNLILVVKNFTQNQNKTQDIRKSYLSSNSQVQIQESRKHYLGAQKVKLDLLLSLLKTLGDMFPASEGSGLFLKVFGFSANDRICGLGGLVSALISCYQLYD